MQLPVGTTAPTLRATTYFAGAIGAASEMTLLSERENARTDLVAASHSLRLLIVTVTIPFALQGLGTGLHWVTLLLGTSPGGIAEMAITAKVLQLGVPLVTAFQVCRLIAVLTVVAPLYRLLYPPPVS